MYRTYARTLTARGVRCRCLAADFDRGLIYVVDGAHKDLVSVRMF